jgi:hypothetical protein
MIEDHRVNVSMLRLRVSHADIFQNLLELKPTRVILRLGDNPNSPSGPGKKSDEYVISGRVHRRARSASRAHMRT